MSDMVYLSYLATALVLYAVYNIACVRMRGQIAIFFADVVWFIYAASQHQWALALQSVVLFCIAIKGIRTWREKGIPL